VTTDPKISVLLPTYRYREYLAAAIESVLAQDEGDFELIVSDDASGDGSAEIGRLYAGRDPRVRFHEQERNLGMVANWNWCLARARGRYIKYLFGDDRLESPAALRRLAGMLDDDPGAVLAASARLLLSPAGRPMNIRDDLRRRGFFPGPQLLARCVFAERNLIGGPSAVMFRRAAAARGFDPALRQMVDLEMWLHLLLAGALAYEPDPLCGLRRHPLQATVANRQADVGPTENLVIVSRYIGHLSDRRLLPPAKLHYLCYRCLHLSRKRAPRRPDIRALEARLADRLSVGWRCVLYLFWRTTRPLLKATRRFRRSEGLYPVTTPVG
jgi:glycosyltransferase involved in cell wall biosynthesis